MENEVIIEPIKGVLRVNKVMIYKVLSMLLDKCELLLILLLLFLCYGVISGADILLQIQFKV